MTETDRPLRGRYAIVTGAGRGMGRAIALGLARAGADGVCVTSAASPDEIAATALEIDRIAGREGAGLAVVADVADAAACAAAVERAVAAFGALHILVNNAGHGMRRVCPDQRGPFWDCDSAGWDNLIAVNVNGPFHMARPAAPHMIEAGWGRILNVSKSADSMHEKRNSPYGPSKAALEAMTLCWAQDLLGTNVTCNTLMPGGLTNTTFSRSSAIVNARKNNKPLYEPEDIAPLAVALASDASARYSGCRFNARGWNADLPVNEALEACRTPAIFPRPRRPRDLLTGWDPVAGETPR